MTAPAPPSRPDAASQAAAARRQPAGASASAAQPVPGPLADNDPPAGHDVDSRTATTPAATPPAGSVDDASSSSRPRSGSRGGAPPAAAAPKPGPAAAGSPEAADLPDSLEDVVVAMPPPSAGAPAGTSPAALAAPASPTALFLAFTRLSLQGFGGVLPVAQRELVERLRWLTREQFVEMLAVSQVLPGPNIVNLTLMFGDRHFGLRGAFAALAGMLLVPMVVVLVLTALYAELASVPAVAGALRGMGAVAAGLVLATGLKLVAALRQSALGLMTGLGLAAAMALATGWLHWPLFGLLLGLGALSCAIAWTRLAAAARSPVP